MTTEMALIAAARVLGSLPVLRWPFLGGLFALLVDQSDLFMMNLIELGGVRDYQRFDKYLDQVYMLAFLAVALRWERGPLRVAVALYAYRLVGFAAFELAGAREILLLFPNLFEFWFLLVTGRQFFRVEAGLSRPAVALAGALVLALKVFQEYAIHYARWLDRFTAVEAVEAVWEWLSKPFR